MNKIKTTFVVMSMRQVWTDGEIGEKAMDLLGSSLSPNCLGKEPWKNWSLYFTATNGDHQPFNFVA